MKKDSTPINRIKITSYLIMKINNPKVFTSIDNLPIDTTIMVRGDVKCMFARVPGESSWHFEKTNSDEYVRYSFDGGFTWPLEFKFRNTLVSEAEAGVRDQNTDSTAEINPAEAARMERGYVFEFSFDGSTQEQWNAVKRAIPFFFAVNGSDEITSISSFRVAYGSDHKVNMTILENLPEDTIKIKMKLLLDGAEALVLTNNQGEWTEQSAG